VRGLLRQRPSDLLGERTFALLGYELVEGAIGRSAIREVRRVNFAPAAAGRLRPD